MSRAMETVQLVDDVGVPLGLVTNPIAAATPPIASAYASAFVTLGTTAAIIVAAGAMPNQRTIKNTDATNTAFLGGASVTPATGFPLKPGESLTFDAKVSSAALYGVCSAGTPVLATIGF